MVRKMTNGFTMRVAMYVAILLLMYYSVKNWRDKADGNIEDVLLVQYSLHLSWHSHVFSSIFVKLLSQNLCVTQNVLLTSKNSGNAR